MLYLEMLLLFVLILLNGVLAMSEVAVVSSRNTRIKKLGHLAARDVGALQALKEDPSRFLYTVRACITLASILLGACSAATLADRLGGWLESLNVSWLGAYANAVAMVLTVAAITYFSVILGEILPKRIALSQPERIAARMAAPMLGLSRAAAPLVWVLRISSDTLLRLLHLKDLRTPRVSEEELRALIAEGTLTGIFAPQEREMIEGVLRLDDRPVRIIMTPRTDITWIDVAAQRQEIFELFSTNRYSRLLVCDGDVDRPMGVIHTKDILPLALRCEPFDLKSLTRPVLFIPERLPVLKLVEMFKSEKLHVAVVVDEHGTTEGLITLTDILESIAGELPEYGEEEEQTILAREDGSWLVDGGLPIDEFEARTGIADICDEEGVYTLAGFVMHHLGRVPKAGLHFVYRDIRFEVVDMDGRRIDKILVRPGPEKRQAL